MRNGRSAAAHIKPEVRQVSTASEARRPKKFDGRGECDGSEPGSENLRTRDGVNQYAGVEFEAVRYVCFWCTYLFLERSVLVTNFVKLKNRREFAL
jgi:hypothetical protein